MTADVCRVAVALCLVWLAPILAAAQGTVKDYQRAAFFQTGEHRKLVQFADVMPR